MITMQMTEEELQELDRDVNEGLRNAAEWLRGDREAPERSGVYERSDRDTIPAPPPGWDDGSIDVVFEDVG